MRKSTSTGRKTNLDKKRKINENRKKGVVKKKSFKSYSETSSEPSDIMSVSDTDYSLDDYITACLQEFDDKENLKLDIPFGVSDITYSQTIQI